MPVLRQAVTVSYGLYSYGLTYYLAAQESWVRNGDIGMAYMVMAYIAMAYVVMAYVVMVCLVMAYTATACIVMVYMVMA